MLVLNVNFLIIGQEMLAMKYAEMATIMEMVIGTISMLMSVMIMPKFLAMAAILSVESNVDGHAQEELHQSQILVLLFVETGVSLMMNFAMMET